MACHRQWTIICTENYEPGIHERKEEKSMKNTLNKIWKFGWIVPPIEQWLYVSNNIFNDICVCHVGKDNEKYYTFKLRTQMENNIKWVVFIVLSIASLDFIRFIRHTFNNPSCEDFSSCLLLLPSNKTTYIFFNLMTLTTKTTTENVRWKIIKYFDFFIFWNPPNRTNNMKKRIHPCRIFNPIYVVL